MSDPVGGTESREDARVTSGTERRLSRDELAAGLLSQTQETPAKIAKLPRNEAGYPVPWFVAWIDGKPDFRIIGPNKIQRALRESRCWICGGLRIGHAATFVIGPMCAVNRISAEPPSHTSCAVYAAQACPFLANPKKRRREGNKPDELVSPAGEMIERNPGVALVWSSHSWMVTDDGNGGTLFNVGEPSEARWFAHGREATRSEVIDSIESGLPLLRSMAELDGDDAVAHLARLMESAYRLVPA